MQSNIFLSKNLLTDWGDLKALINIYALNIIKDLN